MRFSRRFIDTGNEWLPAIVQGPFLLGLILIGLLWIGIHFHLESERSQTERAAVQNSANLTNAFEAHLSRSLDELDRAIKMMRESYIRDPDKFDFKDWQRSSQLLDDHTLQASIIGADGYVKLSNIGGSSTIGTDLRDREHFRVQIDAKTDDLFISKPVIGRVTGKWSIQLTRRITNNDGSFGGAVVVSLDPNYVALYSSVDVGNEGYVRVIGADGILRATGVNTSRPLGTDLSGAVLFKHYPKMLAGWYYTASDLSDHKSRLVTYKALKNYPLIITIGLSTEEQFASVYANQRTYRLVGTAVTLLVLGVMGFGIRARLLRNRVAKDREIQHLRFDAVLRNMPMGMCMIDSDGRLAVCNDQYRQMYNIPDDLAKPGTLFLDIIRYRKSAGTFSGDTEAFCGEVAEKMKHGVYFKLLAQRDDGRAVSVANQPMKNGGWISIHEDITEQQLAKRNSEERKTFFDTIIENVPVPIVVKEPETRKFVLVNRAYEAFMGMKRDQVIGRTVFDIFPLKDAEMIDKCDIEAIQLDKQIITRELSIETPTNGPRTITSTRLVVCDTDHKPQFLISVIEDVTEKRMAQLEIAHMAHHDSLTGLPNRAEFAKQLDEALAGVKRGEQLAVLLLDLDLFKNVNDTLGHMVGDELLKIVSSRLLSCVREGDTVARLGGDEFAIIQTAIDQPGDIAALADRVRSVVKAPYDLGGFVATVDVSIGISQAANDGTGSAELIKRADMALYKAKSGGGSAYRIFERKMEAVAKTRQKLEVDLRNALANGEFELFYQPIVDIESHGIIGLEALLRWHHPVKGLVPPVEFVPIAEETGLIVPLGEWVIRQACRQAEKWPDDIKIAVNLSPAQFAGHNVAQVVINALAASDVAPHRLELEITEEILLANNQENLAVLNQLRTLGVQIVMDDFGTGYSSLNYLRSLPFDKIKIDRSFVNDLSDENGLSFAIVQAVASLASVLKVPTTAEGVETEQQLELVRAAGCTQFQGYLFSPPKPASEIVKLFPAFLNARRG